MANIADKVTEIREAVVGEDVRTTIADGIEAINTDVESAVSTATQAKNTANSVTAAESARVTAENNRASAETTRASAESNRVTEFNQMKTAYESATHENTEVELTDSRRAADGTIYNSTGEHVRALGASMADIKHYNVAYVETWGNDSTAALGQIGKPFKTINAALDAVLPSLGGKIVMGIGVHDPVNKTKFKDGVTFEGTHVPHVKSDYTGLEGGTVIKGPFQPINKNHIKMYNFGVDSGSAVCAELYANANTIEGITVSTNDIGGSGEGGTFLDRSLLKGIVMENIVAICKSATAQVHTILVESVEGAYLNNLETYYGLHGMALKLVKSQATNLRAHGAGYDGITIKHSPTFYAPCSDSQFNNLYMDSINGVGAGFILQGTAAGTYFVNIAITNIECYDTDFGVKIDASSAVIAGCTVQNIILDKIRGIPFETVGSVARNDFDNIFTSAPVTDAIVLSSNTTQNSFSVKLISEPSLNNGKGIIIKGSKNKFKGIVRGFKLGGVDGSLASDFNYLEDLTFLDNQVSDLVGDVSKLIVDGYSSCMAYSNVAQSVNSGANTNLTLNIEKWDTHGIHDVATNNTRLTCKVAGKYAVKGGAEFAANGTGYRYLILKINGVQVSYIPVVTATPLSSVGTALNISYDLPLNVGDYVELAVIQNSGTALNVNGAALSISRIAN